ncbi:MAG: hypothetical protein IT563_23460 [Alphaproteobacteria bacterium]|nr:hypothetical protein [Alphaproteobacteria bacterium]
MQVQSNLGPAGIGGTNAAVSAQAPDATPPPPPAETTTPPPAPDSADKAVVAREENPTPPPVPTRSGQKEVLPRARLNYDVEREEVFVEVLDRLTGKVLFTFPAKESDSARASGLGQGSLVDQLA